MRTLSLMPIRFLAVALLALAACGDDSPAAPDASWPATCEHATVYNGPKYSCTFTDGRPGVCAVSRGSVACRPECGTNPACTGTDGLTMGVNVDDGSYVCWCDRP